MNIFNKIAFSCLLSLMVHAASNQQNQQTQQNNCGHNFKPSYPNNGPVHKTNPNATTNDLPVARKLNFN